MDEGRNIAIRAGKVITPTETIEDGLVLVARAKIKYAGPAKGIKLPSHLKLIDAPDKIVAPGFIDIHIHGSGGREVTEGREEAIDFLSQFLSKFGTTSFLPTTTTLPLDLLSSSIKVIVRVVEKEPKGARILGIHMEGPYINIKRKGAHQGEYVREPSLREFEELFKLSGQRIKLVTLAPEKRGAKDLIRKLRLHNIIVSVGHSNATYAQVFEAYKAGLHHSTHIFNAMRGLHHREPGVVGAILTIDGITTEIIADGIHLHPSVIKLIIKAKGVSKVILITDAMAGAGMPNGIYLFAGEEVIVSKGEARLKSGTLAGSTLTLNRAIFNVRKMVDLSFSEALTMATLNPAKVLGIHSTKGSLEQGKDADLVIIDEALNVYLTMVEGRIVWPSS